MLPRFELLSIAHPHPRFRQRLHDRASLSNPPLRLLATAPCSLIPVEPWKLKVDLQCGHFSTPTRDRRVHAGRLLSSGWPAYVKGVVESTKLHRRARSRPRVGSREADTVGVIVGVGPGDGSSRNFLRSMPASLVLTSCHRPFGETGGVRRCAKKGERGELGERGEPGDDAGRAASGHHPPASTAAQVTLAVNPTGERG